MMKRTLINFAAACFLTAIAGHLTLLLADYRRAGQANFTGNWHGTLDAGSAKLRLVLKISSAPDGSLVGKLDSVDQRRFDLPINSITQNGTAIRFEMKRPNAVFEGKLSFDQQEIVGEWKQSSAVLPLTFKRTEDPSALSRPQEPKKPYPYAEEEVSYENRSDKVTLAGTLTRPRLERPVPAVLLITGSGSQDRDETVMGHKPFLVLADYLTRRGIAVLRVDDRGVGGSSKGNPTDTNENYAEDAISGVEFLKNRKEIDSRKIGLIGHSEGGVVASLAAVRSKDIAFVVMLASPGIPGDELLDLRTAGLMRANGASDELVAQTHRLQKLAVAFQKETNPSDSAASKLRAEGEIIINEMPENQRARMSEYLKVMLTRPAWYRYFVTYDPRPTLKKLRVPVLAVFGEYDLQVPPKENLSAVASALKQGRNKDYMTIELPRLNHHLQTSETGSPDEYGKIEETISPVALILITDWILERTVQRINK